MPLAAHASGGDVLGLFWLELGLFSLVIISLLLTKVAFKKKMMVFSGYFASVFATLFVVSDIPYSTNLIFINFVSIALPALVWLVLMVIFKK